MNQVLRKCLTKLSACDRTQEIKDEIARLHQELEKGKSAIESEDKEENIDLIPLFEITFSSRSPQLIGVVLSGIHGLIQRGFLRGQNSYRNLDDLSSETRYDNSQTVENEQTGNKNLSDSAKGGHARSRITSSSASERTVMDFIIENVSKCSEYGDDDVHLNTIQVLLTAITSTSCEVHEATLLLAIQACFHIHLISKNQINKLTAKAALIQMVSSVNAKMELCDKMFSVDEKSTEVLNTTSKDSFLVFRALCKLSMKGLYDDSDLMHASKNQSPGTEIDVNSVAIQNKTLSLELILHIMQNAGPIFRSGDKNIEVIKKYLCISLLGNCSSQIAQVAKLSLNIFVALIDGFKDHLKTEYEILFNSILFKLLESENSTYELKLQVLEVFHKICKDHTSLIEFFINYDCDLESTNLFGRIVHGLAKVAKNSTLKEDKVRKMGIEGLVVILSSMMVQKDQSIGCAESSPKYDTDNVVNTSPTFAKEDENLQNANEIINNAVDTFDRKQKMKEAVDVGITKFNLSAKKGLKYLTEVGHIEKTPKSVGKFLLYEERLDKTMIGDYLGREPEYENGFCTKVLYEYVEMLDFSSMPFDLAIRFFLRGFRLPGEAQKIDRLMERFAERYYLQNKEEFASADMAFILAFSTIMLQTNLHNPAIKDDKRMTKEQFIKQNKGITSDGELSDEILMEIYDRIAAEPISMTEDENASASNKADSEGFSAFQISDESRRMDAFNDERKEMMRKGQSLFKKKGSTSRNSFFLKTNSQTVDNYSEVKYLRPMFEVAWAPTMGALSHIFEKDNDPEIIDLCLEGLKNATKLACRFDFPIVRATYINALCKSTALDMTRELNWKNAKATQTMLEIALTEGEHLDESWNEILGCISQLAKLLFSASGFQSDDIFFSQADTQSEVESSGFLGLLSGPSATETTKIVEEANCELISNVVSITEIDQIYNKSQQLSGQSVQFFVSALCAVSIQEITKLSSKDVNPAPRVFSLQKLVEVADFNMHSRSRIEWSNIWNLLATHFTVVGTDSNHSLAMYAIDSLKQLSIKFLQKEELSNFNFQRVFLKPFETIIAKSKSSEIKHLVIGCIEVMILTSANNIRSGWRTIFAILEQCNQASIDVATEALDVVQRLMSTRFECVLQDFVEVTNCLVSFTESAHSALSENALIMIAFCADKLATSGDKADKADKEDRPDSVSISIVDEDASVFRLWWPLLLGLSTRVGDSRLDIRLKALEILHNILRTYCNLFSLDAWTMIFKGILFPILDSAKIESYIQKSSSYPAENPFVAANNDSWIDTVGLKVFHLYVELFQKITFAKKYEIVLPELLNTLENCICQEMEPLARMGMSIFGDLVLSLGEMDEPTAKMVSKFIYNLVKKNLCQDFGQAGRLLLSDKFPEDVLNKCDSTSNCPISTRRSQGTMSEDKSFIPEKLSTQYGHGDLASITDASKQNNIPRRCVIDLKWGVLYSPIDNYKECSEEAAKNNVHKDKPSSAADCWDEIAKSAMTSMVNSLDIIHVIEALFDNHNSGFKPEDIDLILQALEISHWHARSFNEDTNLILALQSVSFMHFRDHPARPPNLLEQEIKTVTEILSICTGLYKTDQIGIDISKKWIHRFSRTVIERYIDLDSSLHSLEPFEEEYILAYSPAIKNVLQILKDSKAKFSSTEGEMDELAPIITKLILVHDYSIRREVAGLFTS